MVGCGIWWVLLEFLKRRGHMVALICLTANTGCMAFETCGSINSVTLIAEDFMQFVMAVAQVCTQISLFSLQQARDPPNIFAGNI